jgi:hypothetical protein
MERPPNASTVAPLHPALRDLALLLGEWSGPGEGSYPSIDPFEYSETLRFTHTGKPFLVYTQKSADQQGNGLHVESGYLRPAAAGHVELLVAQPTGIVEVHEGTIATGEHNLQIRLRSRSVVCTTTAKEVTDVERVLSVDGDVLRTALAMAAVGYPLTPHLTSELQRVAPT